jgi:hypothetical protein
LVFLKSFLHPQVKCGRHCIKDSEGSTHPPNHTKTCAHARACCPQISVVRRQGASSGVPSFASKTSSLLVSARSSIAKQLAGSTEKRVRTQQIGCRFSSSAWTERPSS